MELATATRLVPPNKEWINRYFQGTDPIGVDTGRSKMCSVIWDEKNKAPICMVNFRKQHDHKYSFLQTMLMGLYYDTNNELRQKKGVPEVVESNIGTNYIDYKKGKGFERSIVMNSELPDIFRGGQRMWGLDNKSLRAVAVVSRMSEVFQMFWQNIYFEVLPIQLESFVPSETTKTESWAKENQASFDDALYGFVYAYICSMCFSHKTPKEKNAIKEETKDKKRFKFAYDDNYNSILVAK
jgi:hypothetical protein